ncbi:MAG: radical SAM protein [Deferrisomatales bacterium]|nr:radical SAM protein [Deferrisomatales bacterium]
MLAHHLATAGVPVHLCDANLATLEQLLSPGALEDAARQLGERGAPPAALTSAARCARRAPGALEALRGGDAYSRGRDYRAAADTVLEGLRAVSRARGIRLTLSDLALPGLSPLAGGDLLRAYREPTLSGLATELTRVAHRLLAWDPALVGISATYLSQALPAAALAGLLRAAGYRGRIVLGGGVVTSWLGRLQPDSVLFTVWDALVAGPGEDALRTLATGGDPAHAPGLLAPGRSIWNPPRGRDRVATGSRPRLDGLPWEHYLAPGPILPVATSRGCYWRRCTYCPETAQDRQAFRPTRAGELAEEILHARDTYGIRHLHLTDDAIPPGTLRRLAGLLRDQGVSWYGFVRPEPALRDPALAAELARGGCAMLQLGIESASQGVLDRLGKGVRAADAAPILANLAGAGIRTYVYLLYGVPGESAADREATTAWAAEHGAHIGFLNLALMNVPHQAAPTGAADSTRELSLYAGLEPGDPFDRHSARRALTTARAHPDLREILRRTPPGFGANHAAWVPLERKGKPKDALLNFRTPTPSRLPPP